MLGLLSRGRLQDFRQAWLEERRAPRGLVRWRENVTASQLVQRQRLRQERKMRAEAYQRYLKTTIVLRSFLGLRVPEQATDDLGQLRRDEAEERARRGVTGWRAWALAALTWGIRISGVIALIAFIRLPFLPLLFVESMALHARTLVLSGAVFLLLVWVRGRVRGAAV